MICPFCKEEIKDGAIKCKHCGGMLDGSNNDTPINKKTAPFRQSKMSAQVIINAIGCIIGGALMIISLIFPWGTVNGNISSSTGFDILGAKAFFIIVFGLIILFGGIQIKSNKGTIFLSQLVVFFAFFFVVYFWDVLKEQFSSTNVESIQIGSIRIGFWIYAAGVFVSQISILYIYFHEKSKFMSLNILIAIILLLEIFFLTKIIF